MALLNKEQLKELNNINSENCISIFIPTRRDGQEVLNGEDHIRLKNFAQQVKNQLEDKEERSNVIEELLSPIHELINDRTFWRNQSDGLAVFSCPGFFRYYSVPVYFDEQLHIGNKFYLKPLLPLLTGDGRYYILALTLKGVQLYEATRYSITEINVADLVPQSVAEAAGIEDEDHLQFYTGTKEGEGAMFHGQAVWKDMRDEEIKKYFDYVSKGLNEIWKDEKGYYPPVLLAGVEYLIPIFKSASDYPNIIEKPLIGNFEHENPKMIHERSWDLVGPYFQRGMKKAMEVYDTVKGTGRSSSDIRDIVKASVEGKISNLFLVYNEDIYGRYKKAEHDVEVFEEGTNGQQGESLFNLAAINTILDGGQVYITERENFPGTSHETCAAIYRF